MCGKFPFEIVDCESDKISFSNKKHVQVGPKKYLLPETYKAYCDAFYNFEPRSDDVWLFGIPRSGTTLTQELIWLIANDLNFEEASKTIIDCRFSFLESILFLYEERISKILEDSNSNPDTKSIAKQYSEYSFNNLNNITTRRFMKSHIAMSLFSPKLWTSGCKIIYCVRDPRDVVVSNYHFYKLFNKFYSDMEFKTFWGFFKNNKIKYLPYFEHIKEGWEKRNEDNFLFIRYEETNKNKREAMKKIAKFLNKELSEEDLDKLEEHVQIDKFRKNKSVNCDHFVDLGIISDEKENAFIRKGNTGGWREYFTGPLETEVNEWMKENLKNTTLRFE